jgi:hypothetical protein
MSGVRWPEWYCNGVRFYRVLPGCEQYPCWMEMLSGCVERIAVQQTAPCMGEDLEGRIPDLLNGAGLLLSGDFSFEKAMALHQARIAASFPREGFFQIS